MNQNLSFLTGLIGMVLAVSGIAFTLMGAFTAPAIPLILAVTVGVASGYLIRRTTTPTNQ